MNPEMICESATPTKSLPADPATDSRQVADFKFTAIGHITGTGTNYLVHTSKQNSGRQD